MVEYHYVVKDWGMGNLGYYVGESHMDCMMLMFFHCNLRCMKVHVYAQESSYLDGVKVSRDVQGHSLQLLEERG
jgi:hypothetical protein